MSNKSIKFLLVSIAIVFLGTATAVIAEIKRQDRKISITLSAQEWEVVLQGLSELPMKTSGNVYSSIMQQAQMQLQSQQQKTSGQIPMVNKDSIDKKKKP